MLVDLGPIHGEDELVVDALANESEEHESEHDVVRMKTGFGMNALDRDLAHLAVSMEVFEDHRFPVRMVGYTA